MKNSDLCVVPTDRLAQRCTTLQRRLPRNNQVNEFDPGKVLRPFDGSATRSALCRCPDKALRPFVVPSRSREPTPDGWTVFVDAVNQDHWPERSPHPCHS